MGTLWSEYNQSGMVVNGVILGDPVELDGNPNTFEWDDSAFPNGEILIDGEIIITEDTP